MKLKAYTTCTKLKGIELFITDGIASGEIDVGMSINELLVMIKEMLIEKDSHLEHKLNGLGDDYDYE